MAVIETDLRTQTTYLGTFPLVEIPQPGDATQPRGRSKRLQGHPGRLGGAIRCGSIRPESPRLRDTKRQRVVNQRLDKLANESMLSWVRRTPKIIDDELPRPVRLPRSDIRAVPVNARPDARCSTRSAAGRHRPRCKPRCPWPYSGPSLQLD